MADKRDYYEVLGVDKNADEAALKKGLSCISQKVPPDTNPVIKKQKQNSRKLLRLMPY